MPLDLDTLTGRLLDAARRAGADAADAVAIEAAQTSVDVRGGRLEQADRAEATDLGLRVLVGRRQACVASSDASDAALLAMAERAVAMAREAPEDPSLGLADPAEIARGAEAGPLDLEDRAPEPEPAALEDAARRAEAEALRHEGVAQVEHASAGHARRRVRLAATNGFSGGYAVTDHAISCTAITGEGAAMQRDGFFDGRVHREDLLPPEEVGRRAAERALARAGARRPRTGAFPVIVEERVAASLIGHLVAAANGSAVARGATWLRGLLGEEVLPKGLSLVEDPRRPRVAGSRPFDAEGLPTRARPIVEDGRLARWVLDLSTARRLGMESTANAQRGPASPPSPGVSGYALTQGEATLDELMREMGTGLLVTGFIGATVNPTTGDWSRGASGVWVERGEPAYPVHECTLAGSLRDMLRTIRPANDARAHLGRVVPSLLVEGLTLAGD